MVSPNQAQLIRASRAHSEVLPHSNLSSIFPACSFLLISLSDTLEVLTMNAQFNELYGFLSTVGTRRHGVVSTELGSSSTHYPPNHTNATSLITTHNVSDGWMAPSLPSMNQYRIYTMRPLLLQYRRSSCRLILSDSPTVATYVRPTPCPRQIGRKLLKNHTPASKLPLSVVTSPFSANFL